MGKSQESKNIINPELMEKIELLRMTPEREAQVVSQRRDRFMSELEAMPVDGSRSLLAWFISLFKQKSDQNEVNSMNNRNQKLLVTTIMVVLIAVVMVFGGATATAYASQAALPGDALYPVKTGLEYTQVALTGDAYNRAQLHLRFAQRRMDEITELLEQGRYKDVEKAAAEFELYIQNAMGDLQIVLLADPARGAELSEQVTKALFDYAIALKSVLSTAPETVKNSVEKALIASQDGAGEEIEITGVVVLISDTALEFVDQVFGINELTEIKHVVEIGDTVKVHAILTHDGKLIASEIELASDVFDDQDGNANDDDDDEFGNDNDNADDNLNDNGDDDNGNENVNDDDNGNENVSDDDNGNENDRDDDDGNENDRDDDDGNDNDGDDDDGNDNVGDDDNGNENDGDDDNGNDNDGDDDDGNDNDGDDDNGNDNDDDDDNGNSNDNDDDDDNDSDDDDEEKDD
jgi:hypothetical protein